MEKPDEEKGRKLLLQIANENQWKYEPVENRDLDNENYLSYVGVIYNIGALYAAHDHNYEKALEWFLKAAEHGHALAEFNIGGLYFNGMGVEKDDEVSLEWYRRSASGGYPKSQFYVGKMLLNKANGLPVTTVPSHKVQLVTEAIQNLEMAALQGVQDAQLYLAHLYMQGQLVKQDMKQAIALLTQLAKKGNVTAQSNLGAFYMSGVKDVLPKDRAIGAQWLSKAAAYGDVSAQYNLGVYHYECKEYEKSMNWYMKAANQGYFHAERCMGLLYLKGEGTTQDYPKAMDYLKKATSKGDSFAMKILAVMYRDGLGVEKDLNVAEQWRPMAHQYEKK
ncbi:hypothetical protein FDP41_001456 [Naegleria fowleri]|uniref:Uncharacterized protein n=1 Tax=Naegleria fowleri TaxID=5763 RepID=A0A6A5C2R5_NAEFO|nr:uncharacterized protein FDP41_001456 [Naegleria fowleri]KAF0979539.1 hypothetical protein FDP41_001456 [Naegleria fowleri]